MTDASARTDWLSWTRERWNVALVDAVFAMREGAPRTITRIDATSAFLARVAGASRSEKEAVRASFIDTFQSTPVRWLFDRPEKFAPWTPERPELPFFAELYLSLMVAGADEATHDNGRFRERLAMMLDAPEAINVQLDGLAKLWRWAAQWTRRTARPAVRQLVLPEIGGEYRIGYSKRLAFPGFKDQNRFAQLVAETDLTTRSPALRIIQTVDRALDRFTERFKDEFSEFKVLYRQSAYARAQASPFWGALQDISWEMSDASKERTPRSQFVLELDVNDAYSPALLLRSDRALSPSHLPWRSIHRAFHRDGFPYEISNESGDVMPSPETLQNTPARHPFRRSRASQALSRECIAFTQDAFGAWIDTSVLAEGEAFWLLLSRGKAERVRAALASAGRTAPVWSAFGSVRSWVLVGPLTFSEPLRAVLESSIDDPHFEHRLVPPRMRVIEGLALPEGHLFLPGCTPRICMDQAVAVRWSSRADHDTVVSGELSVDPGAEEATFSFPAEAVERSSSSHRLELVALDGERNVLDRTNLRIIAECSDWVVKQPRQPARWREMGETGELSGLEDVGERIAQAAASHADLQPVLPTQAHLDSPREIEVEAMPRRWADTVEILTAVFRRSAAVSVPDMVDWIRRMWRVEAAAAWVPIQDLLDNGLIKHLFNRHWHGSVFVARPASAEIASIEGACQVRVLGLVPHALRRELASRTRAVGGRASLSIDPAETICGALQLQLASLEQARALCEELRLPHREQAGAERDAPFASWDRLLVSRTFETRGERSLWVAQRGVFSSEAQPTHEPVQLEQWRQEGQQPLYVVRTQALTWCTRSRAWALLTHQTLAHGVLAEVTGEGSVRLAHARLALPPIVAQEVLRRGGGVCHRDELGRRVYPASTAWAPASLLARWIRRSVDRARVDAARERLRAALSHATGVPQAVLGSYWSMTKASR